MKVSDNSTIFRMKHAITHGAIALLLLGATASAQAAPPAAHDPVMMKQGDTYYLFTTGSGITLQRSRDLLTWEISERVLKKIQGWTAEAVPGFNGHHLWAPDISRVNGKYYLYYSVSTFGSNQSCIGLAENETLDPADPAYKWVDRGKVICSAATDDFNAIDPNLAQDDSGRYWLALGSFWSGIKLVEIDPATGGLKANPPEILSIAARPDTPEHPIEAPFIFQRGDFYYLFVSFDFCCKRANSTYNIRVGRAQEITGPYLDRDGKAMLAGGGTLVLESAGDMRGPGHNAVVRDGDRDLLVYHYYEAKRGGMALLGIRPILWTDDGWPTVGEPLGK